jgi:hypothetical protein
MELYGALWSFMELYGALWSFIPQYERWRLGRKNTRQLRFHLARRNNGWATEAARLESVQEIRSAENGSWRASAKNAGHTSDPNLSAAG